ncbi:hypothetical protein DIPPA_09950 [Diplonema papillatum]|nr:hypothetical protein DIPPA_09950 [Diplonema papillatum]
MKRKRVEGDEEAPLAGWVEVLRGCGALRAAREARGGDDLRAALGRVLAVNDNKEVLAGAASLLGAPPGSIEPSWRLGCYGITPVPPAPQPHSEHTPAKRRSLLTDPAASDTRPPTPSDARQPAPRRTGDGARGGTRAEKSEDEGVFAAYAARLRAAGGLLRGRGPGGAAAAMAEVHTALAAAMAPGEEERYARCCAQGPTPPGGEPTASYTDSAASDAQSALIAAAATSPGEEERNSKRPPPGKPTASPTDAAAGAPSRVPTATQAAVFPGEDQPGAEVHPVAAFVRLEAEAQGKSLLGALLGTCRCAPDTAADAPRFPPAPSPPAACAENAAAEEPGWAPVGELSEAIAAVAARLVRDAGGVFRALETGADCSRHVRALEDLLEHALSAAVVEPGCEHCTLRPTAVTAVHSIHRPFDVLYAADYLHRLFTDPTPPPAVLASNILERQVAPEHESAVFPAAVLTSNMLERQAAPEHECEVFSPASGRGAAAPSGRVEAVRAVFRELFAQNPAALRAHAGLRMLEGVRTGAEPSGGGLVGEVLVAAVDAGAIGAWLRALKLAVNEGGAQVVAAALPVVKRAVRVADQIETGDGEACLSGLRYLTLVRATVENKRGDPGFAVRAVFRELFAQNPAALRAHAGLRMLEGVRTGAEPPGGGLVGEVLVAAVDAGAIGAWLRALKLAVNEGGAQVVAAALPVVKRAVRVADQIETGDGEVCLSGLRYLTLVRATVENKRGDPGFVSDMLTGELLPLLGYVRRRVHDTALVKLARAGEESYAVGFDKKAAFCDAKERTDSSVTETDRIAAACLRTVKSCYKSLSGAIPDLATDALQSVAAGFLEAAFSSYPTAQSEARSLASLLQTGGKDEAPSQQFATTVSFLRSEYLVAGDELATGGDRGPVESIVRLLDKWLLSLILGHPVATPVALDSPEAHEPVVLVFSIGCEQWHHATSRRLETLSILTLSLLKASLTTPSNLSTASYAYSCAFNRLRKHAAFKRHEHLDVFVLPMLNYLQTFFS